MCFILTGSARNLLEIFLFSFLYFLIRFTIKVSFECSDNCLRLMLTSRVNEFNCHKINLRGESCKVYFSGSQSITMQISCVIKIITKINKSIVLKLTDSRDEYTEIKEIKLDLVITLRIHYHDQKVWYCYNNDRQNLSGFFETTNWSQNSFSVIGYFSPIFTLYGM